MPSKELRVGMIGYGFMGRAHSNAYKQVGQFFPSDHRVVLKAACARNVGEIQKFADMGFHKIYLHNVGRNQKEWIEAFGREVLPKIVC
jgi:predicted dehydrogenase